ncbi:MAG: hypothetical protein AB7D05_05120 [Mangrovibacterium sp.]
MGLYVHVFLFLSVFWSQVSRGRLILLALAVLLLAALGWLRLKRHPKFRNGRLSVCLIPDRRYRPRKLTLRIHNRGKKDLDIQAPVIRFSKVLQVRNFRLNGVNGFSIYPLYLERGRVHELSVVLSRFHDYDPSLRSFYWARIELCDTTGRTYVSGKLTLRKSLFS